MVEFCNEMHVSALIYKEKWKNQMYIIDTIRVRTRKSVLTIEVLLVFMISRLSIDQIKTLSKCKMDAITNFKITRNPLYYPLESKYSTFAMYMYICISIYPCG